MSKMLKNLLYKAILYYSADTPVEVEVISKEEGKIFVNKGVHSYSNGETCYKFAVGKTEMDALEKLSDILWLRYGRDYG